MCVCVCVCVGGGVGRANRSKGSVKDFSSGRMSQPFSTVLKYTDRDQNLISKIIKSNMNLNDKHLCNL